MCFHHVSIFNILGIFGRIQKRTKTCTFRLAQNQFPIPEHHLPEMATHLVGGTLHLQLESPRFKS